MMLDGSFYFNLAGKNYVSKKGVILFRHGETDYYSKSKSAAHSYYAIRFTTDERINMSLFRVVQETDKFEYYVNLFKKALDYYENKNYAYILKIKSVIYQILGSMLTENAFENKSFKKRPLIAPSVLFLEKNIFNKNINIEMIAAESNVSSTHFRNIFKEIYGMSPVKYIMDKRLEKATELLFYSNLNVNEIADQLGYNSTIYFDKIFKKKYGISPTEYRTNRP